MAALRVLLLLSGLLTLSNADLGVSLIEKCCDIGVSWATENRGQCPPFSRSDLPVTAEETENCKSVVDLCCLQEAESQQCDKGNDVARERGTCSSLRVYRSNTDSFVHTKECCTCCMLGQLAANSATCDLFERSGRICDRSAFCCESFYTCCNSTEVSPLHTTTLPPITTTEDPDVQPVHSPDGICYRFHASLCEHFCHDAPNRPNNFRCTCRRGFELAANLRNCVPSEVSPTCETNNPCDSSAECYMRSGTPTCRCTRTGYRLASGTSCEDINECLQGRSTCRSNELCENTQGGYRCTEIRCPEGQVYDLNSAECVTDRNNPNRGNAHCYRDEIYDHVLGRCVSASPINQQCPAGYAYNVINDRCEDLDECISDLLHSCNDTTLCRNLVGTYLCECAPGKALNPNSGGCEDIDECALGQDNCESGQRCENTVGSYVCRRHISCGTGYSLQGGSQSCVDINECITGTHDCGVAFTCRNLPGSFRCEYKSCATGERLNIATGQCEGVGVRCDPGFVWETYSRQCQDVNECFLSSPCRADERCVNTEGSYRCTNPSRLRCYDGYELNVAGTSCVDIDECETGQHNCESRDKCSNMQGSFRCNCATGYRLNPATNACEDIDECSRSVGQFCSPTNSVCVNSPGSFTCQCKPGFQSIANGRACQDINECLQPNVCDHTCHNIWGSHQCRCRPGYRLADDKRTCIDVDECRLTESRGTLCSGFCQNIPGSFQCTCPPGFRLSENGRECLDVNECTEGIAHQCTGQDQICINTRGGYKCNTVQCPRYFSLASESLASMSEQGVYCHKRCPASSNLDAINCYLNSTNVISFHFISIPSVTALLEPLTLFTLDTTANTFYPNVEFEILNDRRGSPFSVTQEDVYRGSLLLLKPIEGPQEFILRLRMQVSNLNRVVITSQIAVVTIDVSQYEYHV